MKVNFVRRLIHCDSITLHRPHWKQLGFENYSSLTMSKKKKKKYCKKCCTWKAGLWKFNRTRKEDNPAVQYRTAYFNISTLQQ